MHQSLNNVTYQSMLHTIADAYFNREFKHNNNLAGNLWDYEFGLRVFSTTLGGGM